MQIPECTATIPLCRIKLAYDVMVVIVDIFFLIMINVFVIITRRTIDRTG